MNNKLNCKYTSYRLYSDIVLLYTYISAKTLYYRLIIIILFLRWKIDTFFDHLLPKS